MTLKLERKFVDFNMETSPTYMGIQVPEVTSAELLQKIRNRAISRWGEKKWLPRLTEEYIKISGAETTIKNRSPQIKTAFEVGNCRLDTAIFLARAVGCSFKVVCVSVEEL